MEDEEDLFDMKEDQLHLKIHQQNQIDLQFLVLVLVVFTEKEVAVFGCRNPEEISWAETESGYIIEPTGVFTDKYKYAAHFQDGQSDSIVANIEKRVRLFIEKIRKHFGIEEDKKGR
ncbi:hypothetical protein C5167_006489 [Papaver somniferum]|uniref:Uncharacterized protein n=1 Tax=Papaver somniferum TaxID=3469 RepID=A0A4Y7JHP9_PAPSO|nr:hypothetical protein C5167_006489 [Papaver somniferum]